VLSGANTLISGDAPGVVSAYLEEKLGAPVLFINGAAGNAAPIYSVYPTAPAGHLSEFRVLLGDRILDANNTLGKELDGIFLLQENSVDTPLKPGLEWPTELARYARTEESGHVLVRLPVRVLRVGSLVIWSAPVELFSEIAIELRRISPYPQTFYFGYTNGWFGYLPTARAFAEGGYEPQTSPFTPEAEAHLWRAMYGMLNGLQH
jgi:hypothetical protein